MERVWIYQADRFLTDNEVSLLSIKLAGFVASWTAHGSALAGKAYVEESLFLIFEVDERQAGVTGCSIDKSVHFIKGLEQELNIGFFDRMRVAYRDENNTVQLVSRKEFEEKLHSGLINPDTIVFNNLVQNKQELEDNWQIPFKDSWHSKVF